MSICGKPIQTIRQRLEHFFAGSAQAPRWHYVLYSSGVSCPLPYLAAPRYLWRMVRTSFRRGLPGFLSLPVRGAEIRVKNNLRLVYPDGNILLSAKIGLPSAYRKGSLAREIRARKLLGKAAAGSVRVPPVIDYDARGLCWFKEPFVAAIDKTPPAEKAGRFLADYAYGFYKQCARPRPIAQQLRIWRLDFAALQACFGEAGNRLPEDARSRTWPVSRVHGDLAAGNMIAAQDGRLVVVDWEFFGRGPVAYDLRSLHYLRPQQVHELLRSLCSSGDLEPALQMRLAFAVDLALLRRNRSSMLAYYRQHLGRNQSIALELFAQRERGLLARISNPLHEVKTS